MYCHWCANQLPVGHRGIYCEGGECKRASNNAKKNRKAQRICRLCGRGPAPYLKALRNLYRAARTAPIHAIKDDGVLKALAEIGDLLAQRRAERAAQQKAEESNAAKVA